MLYSQIQFLVKIRQIANFAKFSNKSVLKVYHTIMISMDGIISFSLSAPRVPIETITDPPAIKFPQHDDPTEICITFRTGNLQGADSRSIFVTVQAESEGSEDVFVGK